jgi:hypothetical protein
MTDNRLSRLAAEALVATQANSRFSRVLTEALIANPANTRVSRVVSEALIANPANTRVSRFLSEVLYKQTRVGYSGAVLDDYPVAYWRLGDTASPMTDKSPNGFSGTYSIAGASSLSKPGLVNGDANTSLLLNGSSEYASLSSASWMNLSSMTLEAVIYPADVSSFRSILDRDDFTSTQRQFQFRITNTGKIEFLFWTADNAFHSVIGSTTLAVNVIRHVAATYDAVSGVCCVYVNGVLDATATVTGGAIRSVTATFSLGVNRNTPSGTQWFSGRIQEAAIYGAALSASRISAHSALVFASAGQAIKYWDGTAMQPATAKGWWDGSAIQPVTAKGWWDGSAIQPLS